jgi:hypothetical protein
MAESYARTGKSETCSRKSLESAGRLRGGRGKLSSIVVRPALRLHPVRDPFQGRLHLDAVRPPACPAILRSRICGD